MTSAKIILTTVLLLLVTIALTSFDKPTGWLKGGDPEKYEMGVEKGVGPKGKNAGTIKSLKSDIEEDFATLMQNFRPGTYLGKRVRMSGIMKTKNVSAWAGFWFRVDPNLGFDNMHDGKKDVSIGGTNDWKEYSVVVDVPEGATNIAFGALMAGTGQMWFTNVKFEIVDKSVQTTGFGQVEMEDEGDSDMKNMRASDSSEPVNLDFEK